MVMGSVSASQTLFQAACAGVKKFNEQREMQEKNPQFWRQ